ncbi:hypothetical protein Scep_023933 [Stephania cephalantha]|uniref:Uncharacterized protein n=1 Tax=Stephania cephalantha TaxID=152367 RepID=A0AAP0F127_9MAGN
MCATMFCHAWSTIARQWLLWLVRRIAMPPLTLRLHCWSRIGLCRLTTIRPRPLFAAAMCRLPVRHGRLFVRDLARIALFVRDAFDLWDVVPATPPLRSRLSPSSPSAIVKYTSPPSRRRHSSIRTSDQSDNAIALFTAPPSKSRHRRHRAAAGTTVAPPLPLAGAACHSQTPPLPFRRRPPLFRRAAQQPPLLGAAAVSRCLLVVAAAGRPSPLPALPRRRPRCRPPPPSPAALLAADRLHRAVAQPSSHAAQPLPIAASVAAPLHLLAAPICPPPPLPLVRDLLAKPRSWFVAAVAAYATPLPLESLVPPHSRPATAATGRSRAASRSAALLVRPRPRKDRAARSRPSMLGRRPAASGSDLAFAVVAVRHRRRPPPLFLLLPRRLLSLCHFLLHFFPLSLSLLFLSLRSFSFFSPYPYLSLSY